VRQTPQRFCPSAVPLPVRRRLGPLQPPGLHPQPTKINLNSLPRTNLAPASRAHSSCHICHLQSVHMHFSHRYSSLDGSHDSSPRIRLFQKYSISTTTLIISTFSLLYLVAFRYYHYTSYRDPTSYFFDPSRAYERLYSSQRIREAEAYIVAAEHAAPPVRSPAKTPILCVGIATVARRGQQYVGETVGSLLAGLSNDERKNIFLNLLIAHTEPSKHPVFAEKWVETLPDRLLEYNKDSPDFDRVRDWEEGGWYRNKTIYDYTYLLKDCYNTGAQYVAMVEDDTIAVAGWFPRALKAIDIVTTEMHSRPPYKKWIYLRMFYADDLLGWNSEDWPKYLFWSFAIWATLTGTMVAMKKRFRRPFEPLSHTAIALLSCLGIPAAISLYFMAGRQSMQPISPGVHEMNKYGCCSQGFIFPRSIIPSLLERTDLVTDWLVDMMIETIADKAGYTRWAVVPSLLQHIGATSSKGYGFDNSARRLWNFRFEEYPYER
jgi:N-Acetylglucosaminyltransferase-IV (GnT-IV) conserved region